MGADLKISISDQRSGDDPDKVKREHWKMVREAIVHEDNLINHRLTWILLSQGFLLGGFAAVFSSLQSSTASPDLRACAYLLLAIVFIVGIFYCLIVGTAVALAHDHHAHLREWWMTKYKDEKRNSRDVDKEIYHKEFGIITRFWSEPEFKYADSNSNIDPCHPTRLTDEPPVAGEFSGSDFQSVKLVPFLFIILNVVITAACLILAGSNYFGSSPPVAPRSVRIRMEGAEDPPKAKTVLDRDRDEQDRPSGRADRVSEATPAKSQ